MKKLFIAFFILLLAVPSWALDIDVDNNNATDIAYGGTNATDAATARSNLGLEIGVDVEAAQTQASQAEMEAGTENGIRSMSPLLVKQAIDALGSLSSLSSDLDSNLLDTDGSELDLDLQSPNYFFAGPSSGVDTGKPTFRTIVAGDLPAASATGIGAVELATTAEVVTGTDPERAVTPAGVTARLAAPGAIGSTTPAAGTFTTLEAASGAFEVDADGNVEGKSFLATKASGVAGKIWAYEANSTDTSKMGFQGPDAIDADLYFKFSSTSPTAGQAMRFAAPSSNVSDISWYTPEATQTGTHSSPSTTNPLAPTWAGPMHVIWYNTSGEIDLPAASGYTGKGLIIYNMGANTITVDPNGSEVVVRDGTVQSGGVSFTLSSGAGNYVGLFCDGVRWITLGYKGTLAEGS